MIILCYKEGLLLQNFQIVEFSLRPHLTNRSCLLPLLQKQRILFLYRANFFRFEICRMALLSAYITSSLMSQKNFKYF
jgi:hypothetical protein